MADQTTDDLKRKMAEARVDAAMRSLADFLGLRGAAREIGREAILSLPATGAEVRQMVAKIILSADRTNPQVRKLREAIQEVFSDER